MRTTRFSFLLALGIVCFLAPSGAQAQFCQGPNGPYWCGNPNSCVNCTTQGWDCDTPCVDHLGNSTTCGANAGNPANDLDSDGVVNNSDNCICTPNSNQADCDSDGFGNACDSVDNSWHVISTSSTSCSIGTAPTASGNERISIGGKQIWKSDCTGTTCVGPYPTHNIHCQGPATFSCCTQGGGSAAICGLLPGADLCGVPKCSFF